jgi:NitT/TauT family transport system ATP-binding protein
MIVGLTPASAGTISIFGRPVAGPFTDCGIVFQQPVLLDWRTVIDNVLFNIASVPSAWT